MPNMRVSSEWMGPRCFGEVVAHMFSSAQQEYHGRALPGRSDLMLYARWREGKLV